METAIPTPATVPSSLRGRPALAIVNSNAIIGHPVGVLHFIARKRLAAGKLTVVDATNITPEDRKPLVQRG